MAATPFYLQFAQIPSGQTYLFADADAWNSWHSTVYGTLIGDNLPDAALETKGGVKMASYPYLFYADPGNTFTYVSVTDTGSIVQQVPSRADFDALYALVKQIADNLGAMQVANGAAGQSISAS